MSRCPRMMFVLGAVMSAAFLAVPRALVADDRPAAERAFTHHDHRGTPRLLFPTEFQARGVTAPEDVAWQYLEAHRELFQLPSDPGVLVPNGVRRSVLGTHVSFRQQLDGITVKGAEITVSVAPDGSVYKVFNNVYPVIQRPATSAATLSHDDAIEAAWRHLRVHGQLLDRAPTSELVYLPEGLGFRLVYLSDIGISAPFGHWQVEIDAVSGLVTGVRRTEIPRKPGGESKLDFQSFDGEPVALEVALDELAKRAAEDAAERSFAAATLADGSGLVFDPDPKATLASDSILDSSPASTFDTAYFTRTLRDLSYANSTYRLQGAYVTIADFESPTAAPSTTTDGNWTAVRGNNAFNDAMTYFHIDQNQRYLQSLGFNDVQNGPIQVDTHGLSGADNSHYIPSTNQLAFGHGGVDDNEDADVILHEYGHAITHDIAPSWGGGDSGAIGEGFGDYWGGSYSYVQPNGATFHPAWAFTWDGHNSFWQGRVMDLNPATNQYSSSCSYPAHSSCNGVSGDELWGSPVFQSLVDIISSGGTREGTDQIMIEAQFGLGAGVRMPDMASSLVAAAQALYPGGPYRTILENQFVAYNILDMPTLPAPTLSFPAGGETLYAGAAVNVTWTSGGAPETAVYAVDYTSQCTPLVSFSDDMESGGGSWTVSHDEGSVDWSLGTASPHSPSHAWFATDPAGLSDQYLALASPMTLGANAELEFWHSYNLENSYDGGVVEISTDSGASWTDLGSRMTENGYNTAAISSSYGSPIAGQPAFSGSSSGYLRTTVDLSDFAGSDVQIRFRMASDSSQAGVGWYVDDLSIQQAGAWSVIGASAPGATSLPWTVPAVATADYCIRVTGHAEGYTDSSATGEAFTVVGSGGDIFADDFESGDTTAWSASVPVR